MARPFEVRRSDGTGSQLRQGDALRATLSANTLALDSGAYVLTGTDVTLTVNTVDPRLDLGAGTYVITGAALSFDVSGVLDSGAYAIVGSDVTLVAVTTMPRIDLLDGVYTITGFDVGLAKSLSAFTLGLEAGSYVLTGSNVVLSFDPGSEVHVATQNTLGLIYDYQLDAWTSRYTPRIRHYAQWVNHRIKVREMLCAQYDGHIRRMDTGTDFDGIPIESYWTTGWMQPPPRTYSPSTASGIKTTRVAPIQANVVQWIDITANLRGTAAVMIDARFADDPHDYTAATFTTFATMQTTPDGDKGYAYLGKTSRWIQIRFRAIGGWFETSYPITIGYNVTASRV